MTISLAENVTLHVIPTKKYKTTRVLIRFATDVTKENASYRTLLSSLLETSSANYPTNKQMNEHLSELYGASFGSGTGKKGNQHFLEVSLSVVNEKFLPRKEAVLAAGIDFLEQVLFYPNVQDGQFDKAQFEREKRNLMAYIQSIYDDKQSRAGLSLQALYFEDYPEQAIPSFGDYHIIKNIENEALVSYYHQMLREDQIDIMVLGDVEEESVRPLFESLPFQGRSISAPSFFVDTVATSLKEQTECLEVKQGKLNMGYQTDVYYYDEDYFAAQVFNGLFGGFPHSKLFMNVREKESMAYYASSHLDTFRGMLTVQTGIDDRLKDKVMTLIDAQLASLQLGEISQEDLFQTKEMLKNQYRLSQDNPSVMMEVSYLSHYIPNMVMSDDDWFNKIDAVEVADVQRVAQRVKKQAIYFMKGVGERVS